MGSYCYRFYVQKSIEKPIGFAFLQLFISAMLSAQNALAQTAAPTARQDSLYKPGTEFTMGAPELANPLTAYDQYADPKPYASVALNQTPGCKNLEVWEPVVVSRTHWNTIASQIAATTYTGVLAIAAEVNCVKLGHPAHIAELNSATGLMTTLGWFMPTGLAAERPEFTAQEDRLRVSAGLLGYTKQVMFVSGRVIYYDRTAAGKRYAPRMLGVRMITRKQMESAIHEGKQIIDVRSKRQFAAAHVKGAVHVPYTVGARMKIFDEYANYVKAGDAFDMRRVNPDKQKPVILMSEGPYSDNVFRAAVVLRSEGWKQIFLFFEGMDYFTKMLWKPPAASGLVEVINRPANLAMIRATPGARIIDVRSEAEFAEGTIEGAANVPYRERDDLRLRRAGLNSDILKQYGDVWPKPDLPKDTAVIVFGSDPNDWRAYKAALFAKTMGFKAFWYNVGYDTWEAVSAAGGRRYRIVRGGVPK